MTMTTMAWLPDPYGPLFDLLAELRRLVPDVAAVHIKTPAGHEWYQAGDPEQYVRVIYRHRGPWKIGVASKTAAAAGEGYVWVDGPHRGERLGPVSVPAVAVREVAWVLRARVREV
ncbi:hypothetical protein [Actinomadura yumaensis]|uniref:Uncharacterized protein n=1 Tax=Actinomadura yumaensis TaxID=111807 RepID=A0ABW2CU15_9ACTN